MADLPEPGRMPSRRPVWMPLGEACLKSSTFLNDESARKKVTYEVPPAVTSTSYPVAAYYGRLPRLAPVEHGRTSPAGGGE